MAKSTLLKLSDVKKSVKEKSKQEEYTLNNGSTFKFQPFFFEPDIEELLLDFQQLLQEATEKGIEISDLLHYHLIHLMCIKHFSHLKSQIKGGILEHIEVLDFLRKEGIYKEVMDDVFIPKEVNKVKEYISEVIGTSQAMTSMLEKAQQKAQELELKNRDVIEQLNSVGKQKQIPEV